jgi:2-polyprenyl-3-methyl-5-hydroxy-6-metoxy-1,4-benzoquinol methylase
MSIYSDGFFEYLRVGSQRSAREIVPLVCDLIHPNSVVDIGCGTGTWLSVFQEFGIKDILGVDGNYVDRKQLEISSAHFYPFDITQPLVLNKQFDLAISLEVAEHLPLEVADIFVDSLTQLSRAILFSAAIPAQGGVSHLNEQWQDYWVNKFVNKGYEVIDCIRPQVWHNDNVNYWYAQNIFIFAERNYLQQRKSEKLREIWRQSSKDRIRLVHPKKYLEVVENYQREYETAQWYATEIDEYKAAAELKNISLKKIISALPLLLKKRISKKLKTIINKFKI